VRPPENPLFYRGFDAPLKSLSASIGRTIRKHDGSTRAKSVQFDHGVFTLDVVSACCEGARCFCGKPAAAKVEEVVIFRSPPSARQLPLCRALQAHHDAPRLQMGGAEVMNVQTDLLYLERDSDRGNPRVYDRRNDKRIRIKETEGTVEFTKEYLAAIDRLGDRHGKKAATLGPSKARSAGWARSTSRPRAKCCLG
jgi:hypothetical protein